MRWLWLLTVVLAIGCGGRTQAQAPLSAALITLADLPTGWSEERATVGSTRTALCGQPSPVQGLASGDRADAEFSRGTFGPVLTQSVVRTADAGVALAGLAALPLPCDWREAGDDWSLRAISFPQFADESVAYRLSNGRATAYAVYLRRGAVLSGLGLIGVGEGEPDSELLERLAGLVAERLAAVEP